MFAAPYLLNRQGVYYYRRPVPPELHSALKLREIKQSLRTKDKDLAKRAAERLTVEWSKRFDDARRTLTPTLRGELTESEIEAICERHRITLLRDDEEWRIERPTQEALAADAWGLAQARASLNDPGPPEEGLVQHVEELLAADGVALAHDSKAFKRLLYFFTQSTKLALDAFDARHAGRAVPTPKVEPKSLLLLSQVCAKWSQGGGKSGSGLRPKSASEGAAVVRRFIAQHGDIGIAVLQTSHATEYRETRLIQTH